MRKPAFFYFLAFAALFFSMLEVSGLPDVSPDASWTMVLGYALENRLQFGVDVIFTFGPLGYLLQPHVSYYPNLFFLRAGFSIVLAAFLSCLFVLKAMQLESRFVQILFLLVAVGLLSFWSGDALYFAGILSACDLLLFPPARFTGRKGVLFLSFLCLFYLSLISLGKFPFFLLAVASIFVVSLVVTIRQGVALGCALFLGFVAFISVLWVLCGQSLGNLPLFLLRSLEMAGSYSDAMSIGFSVLELCLAVLLSLVLAFSVLCLGRKSIEYLALSLIAAFCLFFAWKAGFVRHDTHAMIFFLFALTVPFSVLRSSVSDDRPCFRFASLVTVLGLSLAGLFSAASPLGYDLARVCPRWWDKVVRNAVLLSDLRAEKMRLDQEWERLKSEHALPEIASLLGRSSVDILPPHQAVIFLNNFTYAPRPVFQGYAALTPTLADFNGDFFCSDKAPRFVLMGMEPIDARFPLSEDPRSLEALLARYGPVRSEGAFTLLERKARPCPHHRQETVANRVLKLGESFPLPQGGGQYLSLKISVRKSLLGHISSMLYKLPGLYIEVDTRHGPNGPYRIVLGLAERGFLVCPLLLSAEDWNSWLNGEELSKVAAIRVVPKYSWARHFFEEQVQVSVLSD